MAGEEREGADSEFDEGERGDWESKVFRRLTGASAMIMVLLVVLGSEERFED